MTKRDIPLLRRLWKDPSPYYTQKTYRENVKAVELAERRIKAAEGEKRRELLNELRPLVRLGDAKRSTERILKVLKEKAEATTDKEERRKLEERGEAIMRRFSKRFREATE